MFHGCFSNIIDLCPYAALSEGGPSTLIKVSRILAQFAVMQHIMEPSLGVDAKFPLKCQSLHDLRLPTRRVSTPLPHPFSGHLSMTEHSYFFKHSSGVCDHHLLLSEVQEPNLKVVLAIPVYPKSICAINKLRASAEN